MDTTVLLILFISIFLLGYSIGRRIGIRQGFRRGIEFAPIEIKKNIMKTGSCPFCRDDN